MSPCFPPSQELGPRAELAALCQPLKTTSDVEGIAGSFRAANWHNNPPAKSRRPSQGADHLSRSSSRVTTRWTTGRPQPAPRCHHHSRRGFCLPMQRGAGSSLSLSLSRAGERRPSTPSRPCRSSSRPTTTSPRGLLGSQRCVREPEGKRAWSAASRRETRARLHADRRRLHVARLLHVLGGALVALHEERQPRSLCFAARRAWPLDQARRALPGELRLFPPATVEGRCTEYHQRGCEVFYPPRATFGFFALCGPEGEARSDYRGPPV